MFSGLLATSQTMAWPKDCNAILEIEIAQKIMQSELVIISKTYKDTKKAIKYLPLLLLNKSQLPTHLKSSFFSWFKRIRISCQISFLPKKPLPSTRKKSEKVPEKLHLSSEMFFSFLAASRLWPEPFFTYLSELGTKLGF